MAVRGVKSEFALFLCTSLHAIHLLIISAYWIL